jgi:deoxycytidylate deaminase
MYVLGMLPCNDCAKLICQAGLTEVIVVNKAERIAKDWNFDATLEMFRQCLITIREIKVPKVEISPPVSP